MYFLNIGCAYLWVCYGGRCQVMTVGDVLQQEVGSAGSIGEECWVVLVMMMVINGHGGWS